MGLEPTKAYHVGRTATLSSSGHAILFEPTKAYHVGQCRSARTERRHAILFRARRQRGRERLFTFALGLITVQMIRLVGRNRGLHRHSGIRWIFEAYRAPGMAASDAAARHPAMGIWAPGDTRYHTDSTDGESPYDGYDNSMSAHPLALYPDLVWGRRPSSPAPPLVPLLFARHSRLLVLIAHRGPIRFPRNQHVPTATFAARSQ